MAHCITSATLANFRKWLRANERAPLTVKKYLEDLRKFAAFSKGKLTKRTALAWRDFLLETHKPSSVNSMTAAVNAYGKFARLNVRVRYLHIQRDSFRDNARELTRAEYEHLVGYAYDKGKERLALCLDALASTGMRVSELRFLTVQCIQKKSVEIALKGKIRRIVLPTMLCAKLQEYCREQRIETGVVFRTAAGKPLARTQIWSEIHALAEGTEIAASKLFPHNLRHFFAVTYYNHTHDVITLSDLLGHTSTDTTRIYIAQTADDRRKELDALDLVL